MRKARVGDRPTEIRVGLRFSSSQSLVVIVTEQLVKEVDRFVGYVPLILRRNKP
jgi:hypothetical protein